MYACVSTCVHACMAAAGSLRRSGGGTVARIGGGGSPIGIGIGAGIATSSARKSAGMSPRLRLRLALRFRLRCRLKPVHNKKNYVRHRAPQGAPHAAHPPHKSESKHANDTHTDLIIWRSPWPGPELANLQRPARRSTRPSSLSPGQPSGARCGWSSAV